MVPVLFNVILYVTVILQENDKIIQNNNSTAL